MDSHDQYVFDKEVEEAYQHLFNQSNTIEVGLEELAEIVGKEAAEHAATIHPGTATSCGSMMIWKITEKIFRIRL